MNKKFSTLMAVLLTAGAWTTLDAEVVVVDAPAIGKSYVLGTAASGNSVTDLVESVTTLLQLMYWLLVKNGHLKLTVQ